MTVIAILGGEPSKQGPQANQDRSASEDGASLLQALNRRGLTGRQVSWRTLGTDWGAFDAAVIRTAGDGVEDIETFLGVLAGIEATRCRLVNPYQSIQWNSGPGCYSDLTASGIEIVPCRSILESGSDNCADLARDSESCGILIRPSPVARIEDCQFLPNAAELSRVASSHGARGELWVQSAPRSLFEEGLWSFVFFQDELVHTALRQPRSGSALQLVLGPSACPAEPNLADLECAARVIATLPVSSAFTRVDMARQFDGQLILFDLDLTAPHLFLSEMENGPDRLAATIEKFLRTRHADQTGPTPPLSPPRDTAPA